MNLPAFFIASWILASMLTYGILRSFQDEDRNPRFVDAVAAVFMSGSALVAVGSFIIAIRLYQIASGG